MEKKIKEAETWDPIKRTFKIEAGFLYYRLRTRELIEELKILYLF